MKIKEDIFKHASQLRPTYEMKLIAYRVPLVQNEVVPVVLEQMARVLAHGCIRRDKNVTRPAFADDVNHLLLSAVT